MKQVCIAALLSLMALAPANAEEILNKYAGVVTSVYDGDTVTMEVLIWKGQKVEASIRLKGIDTPEIRGKCSAEKLLAIKARDFVRELTLGKLTILEAIPYEGKADGKFGRIIGTLYTPNGENINQMLVNKGLAREYDAGKRQSWCE
ncbi:MAG: thermonuclease family protein [Sneathiella sp.]|nr:thermonuclease family protein [Sneathiella sp.]